MKKMIKYFSGIVAVFLGMTAWAQDVSLDLQKVPVTTEAERARVWENMPKATAVSFATSSRRFQKELPPAIVQQNTWAVKAWKNEKVHTQVLTWSKQELSGLTVTVSDLKDQKGNTIEKKHITTGFLEYVLTDEFRDGCGYRKSADFDSSYVADRINTDLASVAVAARTTQPLWLSIRVPEQAAAGRYTGTVTVHAGREFVLQVVLTVLDKTLPSPADWKFHLDFWQHPAAVARVHQVPLWSKEHFDLMRKYYTLLANAGQKVITASVVEEPWGHQTYDDYPGLIRWTRRQDGQWKFDYSLFDRYIEFVMSCGIKQRINCYSMVPWKIAFPYYDEGLKKEVVFTEAIGTPAYNAFWSTMLKDFTLHLKQKGWFEITTIAMDERPMEAMQSVIALLKTIDPAWKISLAGSWHPEIEKDIFDYCVASKWTFPDKILNERKQQGKISTWYTCCTEKYPNMFTFSPPDESVWMGWYTAATRMDGFLRWAYNSWPKDPLNDSRFTAWPAGDTYFVYPGPFSSIRMEKIIEGIQDFEKISMLREQYKNQPGKLQRLEAALSNFRIEKLAQYSAEETVGKVKNRLNE